MIGRMRRPVSVLSALALAVSLVPLTPTPVLADIPPDGTVTFERVVPASYDYAITRAASVAYDDANDEVYVLDSDGKAIVRYDATTGAREAVITSIAGNAIAIGRDLDPLPAGVRYLDAGRTSFLDTYRTGASAVTTAAAALKNPVAMSADDASSVWVADEFDAAITPRVRRLGVGAGTATTTVLWDDLQAYGLMDVADFGSKVFVAEVVNSDILPPFGGGRVRRMSVGGVKESTWTSAGATPAGVTVSGSRVLVSDVYLNHVVKLDTSCTPLGAFGSSGWGPGEFNDPTHMDTQDDGQVWVADSMNQRVQRFSAEGTYSAMVGTGPRVDNGYFAKPVDMDCDAAGNVYVLEADNKRVQVLDSNGAFVRTMAADDGFGDNPSAVTVGTDGRVYVADPGKQRVVVFSSGGVHLGEINPLGEVPGDVAVDADGMIYVSYPSAGWLRVFSPAGALTVSHASSANRLASNEWGYVFAAAGTQLKMYKPGGGDANFGIPSTGNFDVDLAGNTYALSATGVTVTSANGAITRATFGTAGSGLEQFNTPSAVAVGPGGAVWVADSRFHRLQKFTFQDTGAPQSTAQITGFWKKTPSVYVGQTASDTVSGVAAILSSLDGGPAQVTGGTSYGNGAWGPDVTGEGTHTVEQRAIDGLGNSEASHTVQFGIDSVGPSVVITTSAWPAHNSWIGHDLTVTVSIEDTTSGVGTSYIPAYYTEVSPGTWVASQENTYIGFDGITAFDMAGNQTYQAGSSNIFRIDKTPPVTTLTVAADTAAPRTFQLFVDDGMGSWGTTTYWSVDGGPAESGTGNPFSQLSDPGTYTVEFRSVDLVGNSEASQTVEVVVTGGGGGGGEFSVNGFTLAVAPGDWSNLAETTLTVPAVGVAEMRTQFDGGAWSTWRPWAEETTISLPATEGAHTLYAEFRDAGQTQSASRQAPVNIDRTPPTTTCNVKDMAVWPDPAELTFAGNDLRSGSAHTYYVLDSGPPVEGTGVSASGMGTHTIEWWSVDLVGNEETHHVESFLVDEAEPTNWERIGGANRWAVAVNLGKKVFGTNWRKKDGSVVDTVIIACGSDAKAADPLGAAGLAGVIEAPLLLVRNDALVQVPNETKNALADIRTKTGAKPEIIIIGGTGTITTTHVNALKGYDKNGSLQRIAGNDRYQVAANIAYEMKKRSGGVNPPSVFIASGQSTRFFDPLAAGALAAASGSPVLLVNGSTIPASTRSAVNSLAPDANDRYLVAHGSVVSAAALTSLGVPTGNRIAGSDSTRQRTAAAAAQWGLNNGVIGSRFVGVTNKLPDALGASGALGLRGGGVLYTADNATLGTPSSAWLGLNGGNTETIYVIGGEGSIPNATGNAAAAAANAAP